MAARRTTTSADATRGPGRTGGGHHAFTDLALWMTGFGVLVGIAFPFAIVPLGVSAADVVRPGFFAATIVAGICLAAVNFWLAARVVGSRLTVLSTQMRHVGRVLQEATYTGDWSLCEADDCKLPVETEDDFGEASKAFNTLVDALSAARAVEQQQAVFNADLARHLEVTSLSRAALTGLIRVAGADAGALFLVRDGELHLESTERLRPENLSTNGALLSAWDHDRSWVMPVPESVQIDTTVLSFRPQAVVVLPLRFSGVPIGLVVTAFATTPSPESQRLMDNLADSTAVALNNALAHQRYQELAALDPLTGVYNHRFGMQRLNEEWGRAVREDGALGLLAMDLDHFKAVNDTYGHLAGDRVLRGLTTVARSVLREGDMLVRTGGEEFLVILPGAGDEDLRDVGERMRRAVSELAVEVGQGTISVTVSIGSAGRPQVGCESPEQLYAIADEALYAAKHNGRDQVVSATARTRVA